MHLARHVRAFGVAHDPDQIMRESKKQDTMTGTTRSSEGLDPRRKRLLFRCWHRGTREMDLLLGRFADAHIGDLSEAEVGQLEQLIEAADPDLYAALTGATVPGPDIAGPMFERIRAFRPAELS